MHNLLRVWAFVGTQFIVSLPAIADAPDTLWTKTYGGTDWDEGCSVEECGDGGFIIAGRTSSFGAGLYDVYLIRTNSEGDTLWTKTYGGTGNDYGWSVQECADRGFIIAGRTHSFGAGDIDVYLIRTDSDGDTLWTKTYGGTNNDWGYSVQECAEGGFIIAGVTESFGAGEWDVYLIRTDTDGDTLWTKTYGGTDEDGGESVQECAGGGFIIAGYTHSFSAGSDDVYLIRTDADGDTLWTKTYGGTDYYDRGYSVQECAPTKSGQASGGFIIAGVTGSFGAGGADVYLIRVGPEVGVEERNERLEIRDWRLQIYPNPCMGKAVIKLSSHQAIKETNITIYDLSGKLVKTLVDGEVSADSREIAVNLEELTNGIYFVRVETRTGLVTNNYKATRKLTILR